MSATPEVRAKTRHTIYTLETHVRFLREVKQGSALAVACQVLEIDHNKRPAIFLTMRMWRATFSPLPPSRC